MAAPETIEQKQEEVQQPKPADGQDKRPGGTMFDPETIRKFLERIKKEDR